MSYLKLVSCKPANPGALNDGDQNDPTPMTDWARAVAMIAAQRRVSRLEPTPAPATDSSLPDLNVARQRVLSKR